MQFIDLGAQQRRIRGDIDTAVAAVLDRAERETGLIDAEMTLDTILHADAMARHWAGEYILGRTN